MAQITLGGQEFSVAPYKIRELRQAAPYIEQVMRRQQEIGKLPSIEEIRTDPRLMPLDTLGKMTGVVHDILMVISVGVRRAALDGNTAEGILVFDRASPMESQLEEICDILEGRMAPSDMPSLDGTFAQVLTEAGLQKRAEDPPLAPAGGAGA